jgi:PAS domain S-box-containing protein
VTDNLDVAIYVADLRTSEVLFLNRYAQDRWGDEYRERRCAGYLRAARKHACPFCDKDMLLDAAGKPTGVQRWELEDPETGEWFDCRDEAVALPDGRLVHLEIAVNITTRKQSEQQLKSSARFNESIIQSSCDCIKVLDLDGRLQYMNESGQELLHIKDIGSYLHRSYDEFWQGSDKGASRAAIAAALKGREGRFTGFAPTEEGTPKWWDVIVTPIFGDDRKVAQLLVVSRDITQRKQAEDALEQREQLLRQAQAYAHIGYWSLEADMESITWSEEIYRMLAVDPAVAPSLEVLADVLHPDDASRVLDSLSDSMRNGREHNVEYRIRRPEEQVRWVACKGAPALDEHGRVTRLSGVLQDITERKLYEQRMQASLEEKEVLLREIHHRVKNNLQVVASLLSLQAMQAMQASSPETAEALQDSGRRIQLMAQIHNRLYRSSDLANVQFDLFIRSLVEDIISSYSWGSERVKLATKLQPITLHIDEAIACSQIVSELVSNCVKHAFPGDRKGTITLRLSEEDGEILLWIEDDGVGMPEGVDWPKTNTLGLQVVDALTRQLDGKIDLFRENGTRYRIAF